MPPKTKSPEPLDLPAAASRDRYTINSLARGLTVLECFLDSAGPLRLKELSDKLQVEKATLFRYCVTLQDQGYLELDQATKAYRLGPKVRELGLAARRQLDMLGVIRTWLPVIAEHYGGTASFAVLAGTDVVYVDRAVTEGSIGYSLSIGTRIPVIRSSIGKVLAATLPEPETRPILTALEDDKERRAFTKELDDTRKRGFALNLGGSRPGVNSAAVVVRDAASGRPIGGINVAAQAQELTRQRLVADIGPVLLRVVEAIEIGAPGDPGLLG